MADTFIKPDPDTKPASPGVFDDDDIYEDAGDLEFNNDPKFQSVYLARVPKYLWEAWAHLDDDAEIHIGTIRQSTEMTPDGQAKASLSMLLSPNIAEHQMVPKEYMLDVTAEKTTNTFVFTEQDLPGFKSKSRQKKFDLASANMPARLTRPKNDKPFEKQPYDPNRKFQPYYRKAIPKRTTLAGRIAHEVNCVAVENAESERLLALRTKEAMQPKLHTKFVKGDLQIHGQGFIQPGTNEAANSSFSTFIKTNNRSGPSAKPQQQKTARMPENDLRDALFRCFRKYNYWSMKALRNELKQPEAYLKQQLDYIAILAKSGRFATHWSLKPEMKEASNDQDAALIAPPVEGDGGMEDSDMADEEDEDEDGDVKFEDVA